MPLAKEQQVGTKAVNLRESSMIERLPRDHSAAPFPLNESVSFTKDALSISTNALWFEDERSIVERNDAFIWPLAPAASTATSCATTALGPRSKHESWMQGYKMRLFAGSSETGGNSEERGLHRQTSPGERLGELSIPPSEALSFTDWCPEDNHGGVDGRRRFGSKASPEPLFDNGSSAHPREILTFQRSFEATDVPLSCQITISSLDVPVVHLSTDADAHANRNMRSGLKSLPEPVAKMACLEASPDDVISRAAPSGLCDDLLLMPAGSGGRILLKDTILRPVQPTTDDTLDLTRPRGLRSSPRSTSSALFHPDFNDQTAERNDERSSTAQTDFPALQCTATTSMSCEHGAARLGRRVTDGPPGNHHYATFAFVSPKKHIQVEATPVKTLDSELNHHSAVLCNVPTDSHTTPGVPSVPPEFSHGSATCARLNTTRGGSATRAMFTETIGFGVSESTAQRPKRRAAMRRAHRLDRPPSGAAATDGAVLSIETNALAINASISSVNNSLVVVPAVRPSNGETVRAIFNSHSINRWACENSTVRENLANSGFFVPPRASELSQPRYRALESSARDLNTASAASSPALQLLRGSHAPRHLLFPPPMSSIASQGLSRLVFSGAVPLYVKKEERQEIPVVFRSAEPPLSSTRLSLSHTNNSSNHSLGAIVPPIWRKDSPLTPRSAAGLETPAPSTPWSLHNHNLCSSFSHSMLSLSSNRDPCADESSLSLVNDSVSRSLELAIAEQTPHPHSSYSAYESPKPSRPLRKITQRSSRPRSATGPSKVTVSSDSATITKAKSGHSVLAARGSRSPFAIA